jgi:hypothetical protein
MTDRTLPAKAVADAAGLAELCRRGRHEDIVIECDNQESGPGRDIVECANCKRRANVRCNFDEAMS